MLTISRNAMDIQMLEQLLSITVCKVVKEEILRFPEQGAQLTYPTIYKAIRFLVYSKKRLIENSFLQLAEV